MREHTIALALSDIEGFPVARINESVDVGLESVRHVCRKRFDLFLVHSKRKALAGPKADEGTATVAVFTRRLGQLVAHEFVVDKGDLIGDVVAKELKNPPPSNIAKAAGVVKGKKKKVKRKVTEKPTHSKKPVDFITGAVVVEIDFSKSVFEKGQERKTTEIVFLDAEGHLRSCRLVKNLHPESTQRKLYDRLQGKVSAEATARAATAAATAVGTRKR